jgi:hypothetical protein
LLRWTPRRIVGHGRRTRPVVEDESYYFIRSNSLAFVRMYSSWFSV